MTAFPTDKYSCPVCANTFDSAEELAIHKRDTSHSKETEEGFRCLECGEQFKDPEAFRQHLDVVHTRRA